MTKLIEQQQNSFPSFKHNNGSNLTENNLKTLNNDYILNNQYQHQIPKKDMMPSKSTQALNSFQQNQKQINEHAAAMNRHTPTDPIYYNMNSSSPLLIQQASWNDISTPSPQESSNNYRSHHSHHPSDAAISLGHTNLTYVHSNPSLIDGEMNEYYQADRPPSVRSSYSNFHGARPLSSYSSNPGGNNKTRDSTKDNFFAGLSHHHHQANYQQQQQQQFHSNRPQTLYKSTQPQAIPQVPMKRGAGSRESLRFLNAAPPAYHQYNHHTPPDSETTM